MYQSHWGSRESPFHESHDPQGFYQSPTHEEALARLHFLVEQRRRLGLLLGPEGSGKSLLLELLANDLRRHGPVVACVNLTGISGDEMLWSLLAQFGRNIDRCDQTPVLWRALSDRLAAFRYQQVDAVVAQRGMSDSKSARRYDDAAVELGVPIRKERADTPSAPPKCEIVNGRESSRRGDNHPARTLRRIGRRVQFRL